MSCKAIGGRLSELATATGMAKKAKKDLIVEVKTEQRARGQLYVR